MQKNYLWIAAGLAVVLVVAVVGALMLLNPAAPQSAANATDAGSAPPNVDNAGDNAASASNQGNSQTAISNEIDPSKVVATVDGREISTEMLAQAYGALLTAYRDNYAASGRDLEEVLSGAEGAYYQLQLQYQAAQQLIQRTLATLEVERLGLDVNQSELQQAAQARLNEYLSEYSMTEAELTDLLADAEKRPITQTLLGISDNSIEEIKHRFHAQAEQQALSDLLTANVLGGVSPTSEAGQQMMDDWMAGLKQNSDIQFHNPLYRAYHLETLIETGNSLEQRRALLDNAIEAYEALRDDPNGADPHLDYYLSRLYNLSVNWGLALERELIERAETTQDDDALTALQLEILRNRALASQSVSAFDAQTKEQLETLLQADPGNPYYYYLYAQFLLDSWEEHGLTQPLRIVWQALQMDPDYVDAYVLMGDINLVREFYEEALTNYSDARAAFARVADTESGYKAQNTSLDEIDLKTGEAGVLRIHQLDTMQEPPEDAAEQRQTITTLAGELFAGLEERLAQDDELRPLALAGLGDVAVVREEFETAQQWYLDSLALIKDMEVLVKLGHAYLLNGQLDESLAQFQAALEIDDGYAKAYLGQAKVYKERGDVQAASASYQEAFNHGLNMTYTERRQIALEALALDENNSEMRLALSQFYLERNVYAGAEKQYDFILSQDPGAVTAYIGLGKVALARLQYDNAMEHLGNGLGHDPTLEEKLTIYEEMYNAERAKAGPGNPVPEAGQEMLLQLAALYLEDGQFTNSWQRLQVLKDRYSNYKPDEVGRVDAQLIEEVGDNLPGRAVPDQGHAIITPGQTHGQYNSTPPTSGWHYTVPARWGAHSEPIPDEIQLRNLAAGGIMIQYDPALDDQTRQRLAGMLRSLREQLGYCRLILAPYPGLDSPIVLTAWNRILHLQEYDRDQSQVFVDTFIDKGPEAGEVGCAATSAPGF